MIFVLCMGSNKDAPEIARCSNWVYGSRYDYTFYSEDVFMIDIRWKKYNWAKYLEKVERYKPYMAMAADYEKPSQKEELYRQIDALRPFVQRVMVCPKFAGAIEDIPQDCIVSVSVRSKYAGFEPPAEDLAGRDIHLLGGSFRRQADYMRKYNAYGKVISLDSASHVKAAKHGRYFYKAKWHQTRKRDWSDSELAIYSGLNLIQWFNEIERKTQPTYFEKGD